MINLCANRSCAHDESRHIARSKHDLPNPPCRDCDCPEFLPRPDYEAADWDAEEEMQRWTDDGRDIWREP